MIKKIETMIFYSLMLHSTNNQYKNNLFLAKKRNLVRDLQSPMACNLNIVSAKLPVNISTAVAFFSLKSYRSDNDWKENPSGFKRRKILFTIYTSEVLHLTNLNVSFNKLMSNTFFIQRLSCHREIYGKRLL